MHLLSQRGPAALRRNALRAFLQSELLEPRHLLSATDLSGLVASPAFDGIVSPARHGTPPASSPYGPLQIRNAYGINQIPMIVLSNGTKQSADGSGQTIAIVDAYDDPTIFSDLDQFDSSFTLNSNSSATLKDQYGSASGFLTKVNQSGGTSYPASDAGWALEISLDVEWAHAVAPGAKILLVEASSANLSDLTTAVQYASQHANVVSMSWGGGEFPGENTFDSSTFSSPGVVYVASSGDNAVPAWPSVSPNVVAVGGTTLSANSSTGAYSSETAWSGWTSGSGGGVSRYESLPTYQSNAFGNYASGRTTPDVAYDANPSTGVYVYDSTPYQGGSGWYQVGGTSAGSPQWSAIFALADQARAAVSTSPPGTWPALDSRSALTGLYDLAYTLYQRNSPSTVYHDITSGYNAFYSAGTGYDLVTGLGSPIAQNLVQYLTTWSLPTAGAPAAPFASTTSGNTGQVALSRHDAALSTPVVLVVSVPVNLPVSRQMVLIGPITINTPTTSAPVPAHPTSDTAAITDGSTVAGPVRPTQSLAGPSRGVDRLIAPPAPAPDISLMPVNDPDLPSLPAADPSTPLPDRPLDTPEVPAVPLGFLRAWDDAVASIFARDGGLGLPLVSTAPTRSPKELTPSVLESTFMSGVAIALWGTWEFHSRRADRRQQRAYLDVRRS